jgi:hypothetical protein
VSEFSLPSSPSYLSIGRQGVGSVKPPPVTKPMNHSTPPRKSHHPHGLITMLLPKKPLGMVMKALRGQPRSPADKRELLGDQSSTICTELRRAVYGSLLKCNRPGKGQTRREAGTQSHGPLMRRGSRAAERRSSNETILVFSTPANKHCRKIMAPVELPLPEARSTQNEKPP